LDNDACNASAQMGVGDLESRFARLDQADLAPATTIDAKLQRPDEITVVVIGELDLATAPELGRMLHDGLASGRDVLLDLSQASFIDSTGLAAIVAATHRADALGHQFRLRSEFGPQVRRLLELTGLLEVVPTVGVGPAPDGGAA
jgi:anti-sigma B factor antagonist